MKSNATTGNRCGHESHEPQLSPLHYNIPKNLPKILQKAIERVQEYYEDPSILPNVQNGRRIAKLFKNIKPTAPRRLRSERREAITRLLTLLLSMTDLRTLKIGIQSWKTGHFIIPDCAWMAEKTGMSEQRVHRVMIDLKNAGFITITERAAIKQVDGYTAFRARTAVRSLASQLFTLLGISAAWLKKEQAKAQERYRQKCSGHAKNNWLGTLYKSLSSKNKKRKRIEDCFGQPIWRPKTKEDFILIEKNAIKLIWSNSYLQSLPDEIARKKAKDIVIQRMMGFKFPL